jgi:hypothetical protein
MKKDGISEQTTVENESSGPNSHADDSVMPSRPTRRKFLGHVGGITAATMAVGTMGLEPLFGSARTTALAEEIGPGNPTQRENDAARIRHDAEQRNLELPIVNHPDNGDEQRYPNRIGNFSKNLAHNPANGEVIPSAYNAFRNALEAGTYAAFESLASNGHFGCPDPARQRRLVNPLAGLAFDLEGKDSHKVHMAAPPAFASGEEAAEMTELYWMALLRDLPFRQYDTDVLARAAADDLTRYPTNHYRGPRDSSGRVTPQLLFRDNLPGATVGPYISQFLLQPADFGAQTIDMRIRTARANRDYGTTFASWLDIQNGCQQGTTLLDGLRFIYNGRAIGQYVHVDALHQAYFICALNMLNNGYPLNNSNPYTGAVAQEGFGTFGGPHILVLVTEVATRALQGQWFHKWFVHRRLRPEEFGGRVHVHLSNIEQYPINRQLLTSPALDLVRARTGNWLLPLAFAEGSPIHPSFGAGHATVAGACVTILKALFDGTAVVTNPVMPSLDGRSLEPFVGPPLTVEGELNKLASNVATGRNIAGVHWRSDGVDSLKAGEEIAISILRDGRRRFAEPFSGFTFNRFDGQTVNI